MSVKRNTMCHVPNYESFKAYCKDGRMFSYTEDFSGDLWIFGECENLPRVFEIDVSKTIHSETHMFRSMNRINEAIVSLSDPINITSKYVDNSETLLRLLCLSKTIETESSSNPESIVRFCEKYGLPCFSIVMNVQSSLPFVGMSISKCISELRDLKKWYCAIGKIDPDDPRKSDSNGNPILDLRSEALRPLDHADVRLELVSERNAYFSADDQGDHSFYIRRRCSDLFRVARAEILFSMEDKHGRSIIECEWCHTYFLFDPFNLPDGRQRARKPKRCPYHSSDAGRKEIERAKKVILKTGTIGGGTDGGKTW